MDKQPNNSYLHGHRERLRERFMERGTLGLADYEMLELLLMQAIPRRDVKPIAKELLAKFKTLTAVLNAPASELKKFAGVGDNVAFTFKLATGIAEVYRKNALKGQDVFKNKVEVLDYLYTKMSGLKHEEFHVIYLDSKNKVVYDECLFRGTIDRSAVYPREAMKQALTHGAVGLILSHNHPSGNPNPSKSDDVLTQEMAVAAKALDIHVHDHIIIGDDNHYSFAESGKL